MNKNSSIKAISKAIETYCNLHVGANEVWPVEVRFFEETVLIRLVDIERESPDEGTWYKATQLSGGASERWYVRMASAQDVADEVAFR